MKKPICNMRTGVTMAPKSTYTRLLASSDTLAALALISRDVRLVLIAYITAASSTDMVALAKAIFAGLGAGP